MAQQQKKTLKIVILGDSGVGKTSLMNRYSTGKFTGQYKATIGADFLTRTISLDVYGTQRAVVLQIWDTAGQERFQSLGVGFYRGADGCILCYDITDSASLEHLEHWKSEFLEQIGGAMTVGGGGAPPFPFVVLGNKVDKETQRKVPRQEAEDWCGRGGSSMGTYNYQSQHQALPHLETSAKTAVNVDEAFHQVALAALYYEEYKRQSQPQLFVPPATLPIDFRQDEYEYNDGRRNGGSCC